jgi:hypothetical protein
VEGPAVQRSLRGNVFRQSEAQWRDLRFSGAFLGLRLPGKRNRSDYDAQRRAGNATSQAILEHKMGRSVNSKISTWLVRCVGQNLEQAREISLTFARLDRSLHEVNVRIWNSVV